MNDTKSQIDPTKTPVFIGTGVEFAGTIRHTGAHDDRAVILGTLTGQVEWNGILQVPQGGKVVVQGTLRCREMMIGGEIIGDGENVVIETGLLRLGNSAKVDVATVNLPTGGLEQARGSALNATLRMSPDHPFSSAPDMPAPAEPVLLTTAAPSAPATEGFATGLDSPGALADGSEVTPAQTPLVQVETRNATAALQLAA